MRELIRMFSPEYTITNETLKNISEIEYSKALIENTTLLPKWERQLSKDALQKKVTFSLRNGGIQVFENEMGKFLDKFPARVPEEAETICTLLSEIETSTRIYLDEKLLKAVALRVLGTSQYRKAKMTGKILPEELLAKLTASLDWHNSLDARETHPLIAAAVLKAQIFYIYPIDPKNDVTNSAKGVRGVSGGNEILSDLLTTISLNSNNYRIKGFYNFEEFIYKDYRLYEGYASEAAETEDYTRWIEFFTKGISIELKNVAERVKMLARDTEITKAVGKARLSQRQERIIQFIQTYGMMQNGDFPKIFPGISEDTVLRELKDLVGRDLIVKVGKTKSSRYVLK